MALYKKVSKRTLDLVPVLKSRFPSVDNDIIISVAAQHNNSLIKATEALSEISGVPFNTAIRRSMRRRRGCKDMKVDRRGVPWSKMTLPEKPSTSSDMLSEEEFQKWLQEQLDEVEKERKEKQEVIQSNDVLASSSSSSFNSEDDDQSWDEKSWEKLEVTKENELPKKCDYSVLDDFSVIDLVPAETNDTSSNDAVIPQAETIVSPTIENVDQQYIGINSNPTDSFPTFEFQGGVLDISQMLSPVACLESMDISVLPAENVTASLFGDDLTTSTVYINEDDSIALKLVFGNGSMYRFRAPRKTYTLDKLKNSINEKLEQGYEIHESELKIKYLDEEGDWITIASQEEWEEALRIHEEVLKIHIL